MSSDQIRSSKSHRPKFTSMLLNVIFESWILEDLLVIFNSVCLLSGLSIGHVPWVLLHIKLNTWILKNGFVVFGTGVLKSVIVKLDTWLFVIQNRLISNNDSWVGVSMVSDIDSWVDSITIDDSLKALNS